MRAIGALLLPLLLLSPAAIAKPPDWLLRNVLLTLHAPESACRFSPELTGWGRRQGTCELEVRGGRLVVDNREDWQRTAAPWGLEVRVREWTWTQRKRRGTLTVETPGMILEMPITAQSEDAAVGGLQEILTYGADTTPAARQRRRELLGELAAGLLPTSLVPSPEAAGALLDAASTPGASLAYALVDYKGKRWLAIHLGGGPFVYNELKVSQAQRAPTVITQHLLPIGKRAAAPLGRSTEALAGLKLEILVGHKSFLNEAAPVLYDTLEAYLPRDLVLAFGNDDITSQALIDGSVLLIDGQRTEIRLADAVGD